jgi:polyhydroxyalkanoic acid synthase PhaR subunit
MNPLEFWRQWNEMTTGMWANAMNTSKTTGMNASGFDSSWMKATNTMLEHMTNNHQVLLDPRDAWKLWLDTTMDIWRGTPNKESDPLGMTASWVKVMEKVQEKMRSGESLPVDPFTLFSEWYGAISKPWSRKVEDIMASDHFLEFTGPFMKSHSTLIRMFRQASEAYLRALRLPTLADITHVAELVVNLEEKVDSIEDAVERVKEQATPGTATMVKIADLEQRLSQIETKLDRTLTLLEKEITGRKIFSNLDNLSEIT